MPQVADTPGVAEVPLREETLEGPQRPRANQEQTEGGQTGQGGDENPPTAQATRGAGSRRRRRRADGWAEDGGAAFPTAGHSGGRRQHGALPRKSDGADSARSKNGMHPRRESDLLASEATEGGRANVRGTGSEASHGATEEQEGTEPEEGVGQNPAVCAPRARQ